MRITFGVLADSLADQFEQEGVEYIGKPSIELLQNCANAITILAVHGYLTESEVTKARKRLLKEIKVKEKPFLGGTEK